MGALTYRKVDLDVVDLLRVTAGAFGERLAARGITLELRLPGQALNVFGDERRLQQLFNNLIENSSRYTDVGGLLRIEVRALDGRIAIDFLDTAPGVAPAQLERLFDRFFRVESSRNRSSGGAGLGLAICSRIVEAHEGRVVARASPLGGLQIAIELPAVGT